MPTLRALIALAPMAALLLACGAQGDDAETGDDDLTSQKAYAYTCTVGDARVLERKEIQLTVAQGHLRFVDAYGPNIGPRDKTYRAPTGKARSRYVDFEYGGDCALKIVVDDAALRGDPSAALRVQCTNDDEFVQDVYQCSSPRRTRLYIRPPAPPPAAPPPTAPAKNAKAWTCSVRGATVLDDKVTLQVDDKGMRLITKDFEYEGARDAAYKSRTGSYLGYQDFDYGGDCEMTAVVESSITLASTRTANLKVRCKGDDFQQDSYTCTPK